MAKEKKATEKKPRPEHYEDRLVINGTFMDVINAAVKHTKANTPKKKKP